MSGFVYFIQCQDRVKIGYSLDPVKRLTKVNADAPYSCALLGSVDADTFPEAELHKRFAAYRVHSEWFWAAPEIIEFIRGKSPDGEVASLPPVPSDRYERQALNVNNPPIKQWRLGARLTQLEAARLFGVSSAMFNRWETGSYRVGDRHVRRVADITGIPDVALRPDIFTRVGAV